MQLSVIIVNYNVQHFLQLCLTSVVAALQNIEGEIIVIDNNSPDDSCQMIKEKFPEVILIENKINTGFSQANNQGVALAKGKYVLILNPDTVVAEETFYKLINFADEQSNLGILGVKLIDGTGNFLPESKRGIPTPKVAFNKLFGFSKTSNATYYATHLEENNTGKISVLVGAFMLLERTKYNEVGGFDEDYFMYGEDIDLSYKILKKGYDNFYYPKIQIIHYKGESTAKDLKYLKNFYGAMHIFYQKHFKVNILYDLLMRMGIYIGYWLKLLALQKKPTSLPQPSHILYYGNDNYCYESLQKMYPSASIHLFAVCETRVISRYDDLQKIETLIDEKQIDAIVFDNDSNEFSKILFYFTALKHKGLQFFIKPKNTQFIIGSNDRNSKGNIVIF